MLIQSFIAIGTLQHRIIGSVMLEKNLFSATWPQMVVDLGT